MSNGVYAIACLRSKKIYIGQAVNIEKRITRHKMWLRQGVHFSKELQGDWDKHGEDNFFIKVLEKNKAFTEKKRLEREEYWISHYKEGDAINVYNIRYEGHWISKEGRTRISEAAKKMSGENHPMWGKEGYWKGKSRTNENKKKISESLQGHPVSDEARRKMSEAKKGKTPLNKFPTTPELLQDITNGISYKDFEAKYGKSKNTLKRVKQELKGKIRVRVRKINGKG